MTISLRNTLALILAATLIAALPSAATPESAEARACKHAKKPTKNLKKKQARLAMKCLVNKKRSAKNLRARPKLREAAQAHTRYMRKHNCFAHQCSGEPALEERVRRTGYLRGARSYALGEVIAKNTARATPKDILRQFMGSAGHRQTLMSGTYRNLGVGVSARNGTALYTIVVGRKR